MHVSDILAPSRIAIGVEAGSKKSVLEALARVIAAGVDGLTPAKVFDSFVAREKLGSTALGHGIAIPHGRIERLERTIGAFVRTKDGVDFDAVDGQRVDLFFALAVPQDANEQHLEILAALAGSFSNEGLVRRLRSEESVETLQTLLSEPAVES
jgi:PTS system nitrogen regulatory IIA component